MLKSHVLYIYIYTHTRTHSNWMKHKIPFWWMAIGWTTPAQVLFENHAFHRKVGDTLTDSQDTLSSSGSNSFGDERSVCFFWLKFNEMEAALPKKLTVNKLEPWVTGQLSKIEYWIPEPELARLPRLVRMALELSMLMRANAHGGWKQHGVIVLLLFVWGSPDASWIQQLHFHEHFGGYHSLWLSLWPKIFDLEVGNKSELMSLGAHCDNWTRPWNVGPGGKVVDWMEDVSESAGVSVLFVTRNFSEMGSQIGHWSLRSEMTWKARNLVMLTRYPRKLGEFCGFREMDPTSLTRPRRLVDMRFRSPCNKTHPCTETVEDKKFQRKC